MPDFLTSLEGMFTRMMAALRSLLEQVHPLRRGHMTQPTDGLVHHWEQGPGDVHRVKGSKQYPWKFWWYLDSVIPLPGQSLSRKSVLRTMYSVLNHPRSWERSGVQFVRTMSRAKADILVRFGPAGNSVCGSGAAGCFSWKGGKKLAYIGVEYAAWPEAMIYIIGMELCGHGTFSMLDHYNPVHQPYTGSMGSWDDAAKGGYFPTDTEIQCAKAWLRGEAVHIHMD